MSASNTKNTNQVRPTTPIGEALEQLRDHRLSAVDEAAFKFPQTGPAGPPVLATPQHRFGFPVDHGV